MTYPELIEKSWNISDYLIEYTLVFGSNDKYLNKPNNNEL